MYDQISCKGMDGLRGVFEEQAAARGVHMLWVAQDPVSYTHLDVYKRQDPEIPQGRGCFP